MNIIQCQHIANAAIRDLSTGVTNHNKSLILYAYSLIEQDGFEWGDMNIDFDSWSVLLDKANNILYS